MLLVGCERTIQSGVQFHCRTANWCRTIAETLLCSACTNQARHARQKWYLHWGHIKRGGQVSTDGIQQGLHSLVLEGRATQHRHKLVANSTLPNQLYNGCLIWLLPLQCTSSCSVWTTITDVCVLEMVTVFAGLKCDIVKGHQQDVVSRFIDRIISTMIHVSRACCQVTLQVGIHSYSASNEKYWEIYNRWYQFSMSTTACSPIKLTSRYFSMTSSSISATCSSSFSRHSVAESTRSAGMSPTLNVAPISCESSLFVSQHKHLHWAQCCVVRKSTWRLDSWCSRWHKRQHNMSASW